MKVSTVLFLGGARSGKSSLAEALALTLRDNTIQKCPIVYMATAELVDKDFELRINKHRAQRGDAFVTREEPLSIASAIQLSLKEADIIVLECLTTWLGNVFHHHGPSEAEQLFMRELEQIASLCNAEITTSPVNIFQVAQQPVSSTDGINQIIKRLAIGDKIVIIVSNELGLGIVPADAESRLYRDIHGRMNRIAASIAEQVYFVIAGIPVRIK